MNSFNTSTHKVSDITYKKMKASMFTFPLRKGLKIHTDPLPLIKHKIASLGKNKQMNLFVGSVKKKYFKANESNNKMFTS